MPPNKNANSTQDLITHSVDINLKIVDYDRLIIKPNKYISRHILSTFELDIMKGILFESKLESMRVEVSSIIMDTIATIYEKMDHIEIALKRINIAIKLRFQN